MEIDPPGITVMSFTNSTGKTFYGVGQCNKLNLIRHKASSPDLDLIASTPLSEQSLPVRISGNATRFFVQREYNCPSKPSARAGLSWAMYTHISSRSSISSGEKNYLTHSLLYLSFNFCRPLFLMELKRSSIISTPFPSSKEGIPFWMSNFRALIRLLLRSSRDLP